MHFMHVYQLCEMLAFMLASLGSPYNTWLLIKLTPKGVVFSFFSFLFFMLACLVTQVHPVA